MIKSQERTEGLANVEKQRLHERPQWQAPLVNDASC